MYQALCSIIGSMMVCAAAWAQAYFLPLDDLPTGAFDSVALAVSDDGRVVVGFANVQLEENGEPTYVGFRWTREEGMHAIDGLPGWSGHRTASDVSGDGRTVVGSIALTTDRLSHAVPYVWTAESGTVALPLLPGTAGGSASAASYDGSVIVGTCASAARIGTATRWVNGEPQALAGGSEAIAVTPDGAVVLGQSGGQAARWTEKTGWVQLGLLPGGTFSIAADLTPDGGAIIGYADWINTTGCCVYEQFRWTAGTGMLRVGTRGWPSAISADGFTVVGDEPTRRPAGSGFFRERGQTRPLRDMLVAYRVGPPVMDFGVAAYGMTPDANTVVGAAWASEGGGRQAFIASIGPYCLIDWDRSGVINSQDVFAFFVSFFAGDADYTGDGTTDVRDWAEFYNDWRYGDCF